MILKIKEKIIIKEANQGITVDFQKIWSMYKDLIPELDQELMSILITDKKRLHKKKRKIILKIHFSRFIKG